MSGCIDTYRDYLLRGYATSPLDASIQFFAVLGNGMRWNSEGNLEYVILETPFKEFELWPAHESSIERLNTEWRLERDARLVKYKWVKENIDDILKASLSASYFRTDYRHTAYVVTNVACGSVPSNAFCFPDNIQEDWRDALCDFLDWWRVNLRNVWQVDYAGKTDFWTPEQKKVEKAIEDAYARIYKLRYGHTLEEATETARQLIEEMKANGEFD